MSKAVIRSYTVTRSFTVTVAAPEEMTFDQVKRLVASRADILLEQDDLTIESGSGHVEDVAEGLSEHDYRVTDDKNSITKEEVFWIEGR